MNIVMPEPLTEYIQQQVARLGYENASDYVCELVEADRLRKERLALEAEVLRSLECKEFIPFNAQTRNEMRAELYRRLEQKRG
jgi:Arc/MetJ-type ribon-helix-helix transcriptional regulator